MLSASLLYLSACLALPPLSLTHASPPQFDGTLSLQQGLEINSDGKNADAVFEELFGGDERQQALSALLSATLDSKRAYVLTANSGFAMVARLLNMLLARCGYAGGFLVDKEVQYVPSGGKIRAIKKIVEAQGFKLTPTYYDKESARPDVQS